ncbi:MAG: hypothetical protein AAF696_10535 [Bacteroidota bacterium]
MNLDELKLDLIKPKTQVIVFGKDGAILKSCHSMEDMSSFVNSSIYDMDPLFKSMERLIQAMRPNSEPIFIPCVEFDFFGRKGYFDFQISVHPDFPDLRAWLAVDNSSVYRYYQKIQQQRNELLMEKERRNLKAG